MLNRRDLWLGLSILVFFLVFVFLATLMLKTLSSDGFSVAQKRVAVIEIVGPIFNPMPVIQKLERYIENDSIPIIVIRLNTPGGGIAATQEIYETVKKARRSGKKVIASMGAVAASGGYYIAAACDTIVANQGTITGSIGVIANFADFSELFQKLGIEFNVRKSGKFKDIGSTSRKMTEDEKKILDSVVMDSYDQFVEAVTEGRGLEPDVVRTHADGRIFTGRQALEAGLVDIMGTYQDALDLAGNLSGLGDNPPVLKERRDLWEDILFRGLVKLQWLRFENGIPSLLYLWK